MSASARPQPFRNKARHHNRARALAAPDRRRKTSSRCAVLLAPLEHRHAAPYQRPHGIRSRNLRLPDRRRLCCGDGRCDGGGGGLLTIPALMAAGVPPVAALATNKPQSTIGTGSAFLTFWPAGHEVGRASWREGGGQDG